MNHRTDYAQLAGKLDYAALGQRLERLREQPPPRTRRSARDLLAPVSDQLAALHATGWTYAQLAAELTRAGLPVKAGTLRECLGGGASAGKRRARRRHGKRPAVAPNVGR